MIGLTPRDENHARSEDAIRKRCEWVSERHTNGTLRVNGFGEGLPLTSRRLWVSPEYTPGRSCLIQIPGAPDV